MVNAQSPLPRPVAARAVAECIVRSGALLLSGRCHLAHRHVGWRLVFGDGTSAPVYRETVVATTPGDPCVLVVSFRLRLVRGRGHRVFRWESILNTPLFVGFPGFVSKLWLAHDQHGNYRGVYQWDGRARAEHYARCLWRVLALSRSPARSATGSCPESSSTSCSAGRRWPRPRNGGAQRSRPPGPSPLLPDTAPSVP
jgi:hypothetical protein